MPRPRSSRRSALLACGLLPALVVPVLVVGGQIVRLRRDHALVAAIKSRNTPAALALLQRGADPDAREPLLPDDSGFAVCKRLWQRWRTPGAALPDQYGASALQLAVEQDLAPVIKALLERNAHDINAHAKMTDADARTEEGPLVVMVTQHRHPDLAWLLLRHGAAQTQEDKIALLGAAASQKQVDLARYLLDRGTDANGGVIFDTRDQSTTISPLLNAVDNSDLATTRLLLEHGAETKVHHASIDSIMVDAAAKGDDAMIRLLLAYGAKADIPVRMGTPLCFAAETGRLAVVKTLLAAGANANFYGYGGTALDHAMYKEVPEPVQAQIVALLLKHGADPNAGYKSYYVLAGAADMGRTRIAESLLQHRADVNIVGDCETPLSCAVQANHLDTARLLLQHGARQRFVGYKRVWKGEDTISKRTTVDITKLAKTAAMRRLLRQYRN